MEEQAKAMKICCFLLFLLLLQVSTTASRRSVKYLPGFEGSLPFELETGYIGVEPDDSQLFYYFIKSQGNPKDDPLILWLTGGPGCSAFSGLVFEMGPLKFDVEGYNGSLPTLLLNPHSWTQVSSIIFLDAPIGTGFSYAKTSLGALSGDFIQINQTVQFLRQWLENHPEFMSNQVYIAGDSYSGITVPPIAQKVSEGNEEGEKPLINLKGCILGNAGTDGVLESNSKIPYVHGKGFISDQLFQSLKTSCGGEYTNIDPTNSECLKYMQDYYKCVTGINVVHVLEPLCYFPSVMKCRDYDYLLSQNWANNKKVREALHIQKGSLKKWIRCNYGINYSRDIVSSVGYHVYLGNKGFRSLLYSGDHDMVVPFISTEAWIRSLNYSVVDEWRPWFLDAQVGGYTRTYSNGITFVTVKGGGHTAPEYKPAECFAMFKRWTREDPL
ncbi:serine carboxypeptidase-like 17 [Euphorbia lathyris]|uniref:serine carboxypeptidase-like 17 n=1 Tax=Euphorbia lathyris TaxID=212925 RepID=UPI00331446F6